MSNYAIGNELILTESIIHWNELIPIGTRVRALRVFKDGSGISIGFDSGRELKFSRGFLEKNSRRLSALEMLAEAGI